MKTTNPTLKNDTFKSMNVESVSYERMTLKGTAMKGIILLLLSLVSALWVWQKYFFSNDPQSIVPFTFIGSIGGLIVAIAISFKKDLSRTLAPIYALLEGLAIGGVSAFFESRYPGIAIQAASLTFGTFLTMFIIFSYNIIPITEKLKMGISAAIGGICLIYISSMILGFFGMPFSFINSSSPIGIGFSILVVGIAAFSLLLDFDFIRQGEIYGAPKYMEWYGAFAVMVTLIWLYMEILRLLAKLRDRRD